MFEFGVPHFYSAISIKLYVFDSITNTNSWNFINNSAVNYSVYGGGEGGAIYYESSTVNSKVSFFLIKILSKII